MFQKEVFFNVWRIDEVELCVDFVYFGKKNENEKEEMLFEVRKKWIIDWKSRNNKENIGMKWLIVFGMKWKKYNSFFFKL